jgi:hypothetical protein
MYPQTEHSLDVFRGLTRTTGTPNSLALYSMKFLNSRKAHFPIDSLTAFETVTFSLMPERSSRAIARFVSLAV